MSESNKQPWILAGYTAFATEGPKGLKVEAIAREVNKSKSSFYHHFADVELFTEELLNFHLQRVDIVTEREKQCTSLVPEVLEVLLEFKQDLLFQRQLRIHRNVADFRTCIAKSDAITEEAFLPFWAESLGLADNTNLARLVLNLATENFYLQLTDDVTYEILLGYMNNLLTMVKGLKIAQN